MLSAVTKRSAKMSLVHDGVVRYAGFAGMDGVFHLRLYQPASRWRRPVAIAGALEDDPGVSIVGVPESVIAAIEAVASPRRRPRLIEHHPESLHDPRKPSFIEVRPRLTRRHAEHVIARVRRRPLGRRRLQELLGREVVVWPRGYTAAAVAGAAGERLRREVAVSSARRAARLTARIVTPIDDPSCKELASPACRVRSER